MATPGALRVLEHNIISYKRVWKGTVFSSFVNPVLFLAAMGLGLGTLVDAGGRAAALGTTSYLAFLAPGLMVATAMQMASFESAFPVMAGMKWRKTYHAALSTPLRSADLVAGHLVFVAFRLVMMAVVFAIVITAFGAVEFNRALLAILPAVLTGLAFAAPIAAFAGSLESDYGLSSMFRFVIVPMFLFSGTFFPIDQIPGWLQPLVYVVPLWHGVELTRSAALGTATALNPLIHIGVLVAVLVIGFVAAIRAFEKRLIK
ncbi:MAG: ABC transporter permease [Actinobacteria bacterium]|nr:ABC transporter permease [Actinomycetota bacterium]